MRNPNSGPGQNHLDPGPGPDPNPGPGPGPNVDPDLNPDPVFNQEAWDRKHRIESVGQEVPKLKNGKYHSKFKKEFKEPEVVYIIEHKSGNLHVGIGVERFDPNPNMRVELFFIPSTMSNMEILSNSVMKFNNVLTISQLEKLISEKKKLANSMQNIDKCCICGREKSVISAGLPLCDSCWDETSSEIGRLMEKRFVPPELDIQSKDLRDLLFEF